MRGYKIKNNIGFTLVEVLITLIVVGVVSALTLPALITNVSAKIKSNRIENIKLKLRQGTDKLMILEQINGYNSTEDFVKALSQHYKISEYCSADKIADYYPYSAITAVDEKGKLNEVLISDLNTPQAFGLKEDEYSSPVSFITADGVPYIILYKKDCKIDENDYKIGASAGCIAGIYDWNGTSQPNKFVTTTDSNGVSAVDIQFLGPVSKLAKYQAFIVELNGIKIISVNNNLYSSAARAKCLSDGGRLPTKEELEKIALAFYYDVCDTTKTKRPKSFPFEKRSVCNPKYEFYTWDYDLQNTLGGISLGSGNYIWYKDAPSSNSYWNLSGTAYTAFGSGGGSNNVTGTAICVSN